MRRETVTALGETVWFKPCDDSDLEIAIVPAKLTEFAQPFGVDAFTEERAARDGLVDFRNYTEGGKPVPNTLAIRRELLTIVPVRNAIKSKVLELNGEVSKGEVSAASA